MTSKTHSSHQDPVSKKRTRRQHLSAWAKEMVEPWTAVAGTMMRYSLAVQEQVQEQSKAMFRETQALMLEGVRQSARLLEHQQNLLRRQINKNKDK